MFQIVLHKMDEDNPIVHEDGFVYVDAPVGDMIHVMSVQEAHKLMNALNRVVCVAYLAAWGMGESVESIYSV